MEVSGFVQDICFRFFLYDIRHGIPGKIFAHGGGILCVVHAPQGKIRQIGKIHPGNGTQDCVGQKQPADQLPHLLAASIGKKPDNNAAEHGGGYHRNNILPKCLHYPTPFRKHTVLMSSSRHSEPVMASSSPMAVEKSPISSVSPFSPKMPHTAAVSFSIR